MTAHEFVISNGFENIITVWTCVEESKFAALILNIIAIITEIESEVGMRFSAKRNEMARKALTHLIKHP
jgi:hypothetical protein